MEHHESVPTREGARRREIVELFRSSGRALSVGEVADQFELHVNTIRFHLDALVRHGVLRREAGRSTGPGRPPARYVLAAGMDRGGPRNYQLLSQMLISRLDAGGDASGAAVGAGEAWGRHLVSAPTPGQELSVTEGLDRLTGLLADVGFDPDVAPGDADEQEIRLRHCPFLEVAETRRDVVCAMHLGLMNGALERLGTPLRAVSLTPFDDPHSCLARLALAEPRTTP